MKEDIVELKTFNLKLIIKNHVLVSEHAVLIINKF